MEFSIDYLFADACVCGQPRADESFCATCRAEHERLMSTALTTMPSHSAIVVADPLPGICKNCEQPHPTYLCPEIRALLFAPIVRRVMDKAA